MTDPSGKPALPEGFDPSRSAFQRDANGLLRREDFTPERVAYLHIAGHYDEAPGLIVDSHAAPVIDPVWNLLDHTYAHCGVKPARLDCG